MTTAGQAPDNSLPVLRLADAEKAVLPEATIAAEAVARRFGAAAESVLFYGSVLRDSVLDDRILDFYVVVESYNKAYGLGLAACFNRLLPPNVFYMETTLPDGGVVRAKVAVISARHLRVLNRWHTLNATLWARFAQPVRLVWSRDEAARGEAAAALAEAVDTLTGAILPLLPEEFSARQFWETAFANTYRAELRAERKGKGIEIYDIYQAYFDAVQAALAAEGQVEALENGRYKREAVSGLRRLWCRFAWACRRIQGKVLTVLRLIKAAFTFEGGADYMAYKIRRHSGVEIELSPWQRRHPVLGGLGLFIRLWRQRAFR